ncbi:MAG: SCO family protein [Bryobacteraceae bacterium]
MRQSVGRPANIQPPELTGVGFDQKLNDRLPLDAAFRDEDGRSISLRHYFATKPVIIAPVYYQCPMLCTQVLNGLITSLRAVSLNAGRDFEVLAVSFDPAETPALARQKKDGYVKRYAREGAESGLHFLTGDASSIAALTAAMGFRYTYDPKTRQFAHASGILIATAEGRIARYLYGVEYAPRDVRLGIVEASAGRIGSPIDQLMLFCYHYDPATGKYTTVVMNIVRAAAAITVLGLVTMIAVFLRRERKLTSV